VKVQYAVGDLIKPNPHETPEEPIDIKKMDKEQNLSTEEVQSELNSSD